MPRRRPGLRRDPGPEPRSGAERVRSRLAAQQPVDQSSGERVAATDRVHDVHDHGVHDHDLDVHGVNDRSLNDH